ncbi:MAG: hypothetical protein PT119_11260 [Aphanizomenon gracile PMC627.10]|nr:hypothetical protein [Aphanizomenon gracile PMC638.10]MDM3850536.1 hypothetical protein [Aphanizomenon gracile PMC627.10]
MTQINIKSLQNHLTKNNQYLSLTISIIGLIVLFLNTVLENKPPIFDEIFYVNEVHLINKLGISYQFLLDSQVAVGPLTAIIHYLLQPITHLQVPYIRLVNFCLLIGIFFTIISSLKILGYVKPHFHAMQMMCLPILWPVSGMCLTEIPAMFFSSLSLHLFLLAFCQEFNDKWKSLNQKYPIKLLIASLGGLFFSFAILGRQSFLPALLAFPVLLIKHQDIGTNKRKYVYSFLFAALILPIIVFIIWDGIVPPLHLAKKGYISTETFSIINGFLSFAYAGIMILIVSPKAFILDKKLLLATIFLSKIIFITNIFYDFITIVPAKSVASKIFTNSSSLIIYTKITSGILAIFSLFCLMVIFKMILDHKNDLIYLFLCTYFLLLCATPFKIVHLFSSRYTATTLPIMMLITAKYNSYDNIYGNLWKPIRLTIGIVVGFLILRSFFDVH